MSGPDDRGTRPADDPPMDNREILAAFAHRADGSWICVAEARIVTTDGEVAVAPGTVFRFGDRLGHLDVAEYLEQLGASFGS